MLNHRITELTARKLSGEISAEELNELENFFQQNPHEQYFAELISEYWHSAKPLNHTEDLQPDKHFQHILQAAQENAVEQNAKLKSTPIIYLKRFSLAACAIAIIAFAFFLKKKNISNASDKALTEVTAKPGTRTRILLPDGTIVWLNSGSKLNYEHSFNNNTREVELEGEAFFDVAKDAKHPFIVHTANINIKVLGTVFNVKSYPHDSTIETTLLRGVIEVENKNEPKAPRVILHPHEKLTINKKEGIGSKPPEDNKNVQTADLKKLNDAISISAIPKNIADTAIAETSWIYNKLIFDGDTFGQLAEKMERWFDVKIIFKDEQSINYRFHGVFENETIEQALKALQLTAPFEYEINNNEVEIYKK